MAVKTSAVFALRHCLGIYVHEQRLPPRPEHTSARPSVCLSVPPNSSDCVFAVRALAATSVFSRVFSFPSLFFFSFLFFPRSLHFPSVCQCVSNSSASATCCTWFPPLFHLLLINSTTSPRPPYLAIRASTRSLAG